jgi:hypothetical protein
MPLREAGEGWPKASREATDQRVARSHADPEGGTPKKYYFLYPSDGSVSFPSPNPSHSQQEHQ